MINSPYFSRKFRALQTFPVKKPAAFPLEKQQAMFPEKTANSFSDKKHPPCFRKKGQLLFLLISALLALLSWRLLSDPALLRKLRSTLFGHAE